MTANRIRDFAFYIAIALLAGLLAMWLAFHADRSGAAKIFKWLGLAVNTLIVSATRSSSTASSGNVARFG
jgi:hypothetical protein